MRTIIAALLFLTGCQHFANMSPREASIRQHCAAVGRSEYIRQTTSQSYSYGTSGQVGGTIRKNPGGFWAGYNAVESAQIAERECLLRHR